MMGFEFLLIKLFVNTLDGLFAGLMALVLYGRPVRFRRLLASSVATGILWVLLNGLLLQADPSWQLAISLAYMIVTCIPVFLFLGIRPVESLLPVAVYFLVNYSYAAISFVVISYIDLSPQALVNHPMAYFLICLPAYLFDAVFILGIKRLGPMLAVIRNLPLKYYLLTAVYIFVIANILSVNLQSLHNNPQTGMQLAAALFYIVSYVVFVILSMVLPLGYLRAEIKHRELEQQKFYNETMHSLLSDLKRFKHGYDNTIACIRGFAESGKLDELLLYLEDKTAIRSGFGVAGTAMIQRIGNAGLAGLIISKYAAMEEKGIQGKLVVQDEIGLLNIAMGELCEALGILLDNAIEAAAETGEKHVRLTIAKAGQSLTFTVENSTYGRPDVTRIFEKGWSTKGEGRGLGLWILKKIVGRNENLLHNILVSENRVRQELIIS